VSTQTLDTMRIPAQVRERAAGAAVWDGNVCINFTARFLERLREVVVEEGVLYGIRFNKGGKGVDVFRKEGPSFLTEDFVRWKMRGTNSEA
jgi:RAT1-interacting protein